MAPEVFGSDPLGADARPRDIYSLGCTIYEIYMGKPPSAIMHAVVSGKNPALPPEGLSWSEEEIELWGYVGICLDANPEARPNIRLLRNALWDVRNWTSSSLSAEPETVAPDLGRVQDWLQQEVRAFSLIFSFSVDFFQQIDLIPKLDIR
jgi:serine/threonine protein kinase